MAKKSEEEERKRKGKALAQPQSKKKKNLPFLDPESAEFRARATLRIDRPPTAPRTGFNNPRADPNEYPYEKRFINDKARAEFEGVLRDRRYVCERGTDLTVCKPIINKLLKRKWHKLLGAPKDDLNITLTKEFYANFAYGDLRHESVWVRGIDVPFNADVINKFYGLKGCKGSDYEEVLKALEEEGEDPLDELREAIRPEQEWGMTVDGLDRQELHTERWPQEWRLLARFIQNRILPKDNITHFKMVDLKVMWGIWKEKCIDVGQSIYGEMSRRRRVSNRILFVPYLIQDLCLQAGVLQYARDEKRKYKDKELAPDEKKTARSRAPPPPPVTTTTTTTTTMHPPPPSSPSYTFSDVPLTARESLYIAHSQRDWMDDLRLSMNSLMAGMKELALLQGHTLETRMTPMDRSFLYDKSVEKRLEQMALEDIVASSDDDDEGSGDDDDDGGDYEGEDEEAEGSSDSDEAGVEEHRDAGTGDDAQVAYQDADDEDMDAAADPAFEHEGNIGDVLDLIALAERAGDGSRDI